MDIKVLGPGCRNCATTADLIAAKAKELGVPIVLEKVTEYAAIIQYGVTTTPSVFIDEKLVHCGGVPTMRVIEKWLKGAAASTTAKSGTAQG